MERKYLQYIYLGKDMYPEYINNFSNSIIKRKKLNEYQGRTDTSQEKVHKWTMSP